MEELSDERLAREERTKRRHGAGGPHDRAAELDKPFPPGEYPVVVVGSGPGALQVSHSLRQLGVEHAVISRDPSPGGMFRRFPFFQRLLSWTKPYAPVPRTEREYERYDWNSLISDDSTLRAIQPELMDGTSYFPARPEMERNLATFAERAGVRIRFDCAWESTRIDGDRFVLGTADGEYRCRFPVFAVGEAEPMLPDTPGIELISHYVQTREASTYADREVFIIGKEVSAFELATGFLQWAKRIILASPSPTKLSVNTHSLVGVRARYVQPYEDHVLGGGVIVLDASIQQISKIGQRFQVRVRASNTNTEMTFDVDDVIAATGFRPPIRDLPKLGLVTFGRNHLPALTPFWESVSVKGVYFAGTVSRAAGGLKKNGVPSNSAASAAIATTDGSSPSTSRARTSGSHSRGPSSSPTTSCRSSCTSSITDRRCGISARTTAASSRPLPAMASGTRGSGRSRTSSTRRVPTRSPRRSRRTPRDRTTPPSTCGRTTR